eukprot:TRINITY_DN22061_c0_g1_i1.p1 TRINITY_DN22061_c0_g1~~TRINITY_DN22061_c0_g1_i1.p1  ORF type:complete len:351 (+),score=143.59 TRINITY_DN22061_c0_g1_i1:48-1100(+)
MHSPLLALALLGSAAALPHPGQRDVLNSCSTKACANPKQKYEQKLADQPGWQWNDAGGYCGSWASQRALLTRGAYVSEQQVRDHTSPCGGHDEEILSCNIVEAYNNLHVDFEAFDFESEPLPQTQAFLKWLKKHLVAGYPIVWMIEWSGMSFPIYGLKAPTGMYGHVEPVIGISSDYPLDHEEVYENDHVIHYDDNSADTIYRNMWSLPAESWQGPPSGPIQCQVNNATGSRYQYCIGNPWGFGWAVKGFKDGKADVAAAARVEIDPWKREPDTRAGEAPIPIHGTVVATGLTVGAKYDVYRWNDVKSAFTYSEQYKKATFTAAADSHEYADPDTFMSDSATYYRVLPAQ